MQPGSYFMATLLRFKNSGVMLGIAYVLAFVFVFPYVVSLHLPVGRTMLLLLGMLLTVIVVSFLLNWVYVLIMAFPVVAALAIFFLGWAVYLATPLATALVSLLSAVIGGIMSSFGGGGAMGGLTDVVQNMGTFGDHVGQFFIAVGTGIYVHARALANKVNYVAVGTFVTVFALVGVAAGLTGLSGVAMFLVAWLLIYVRMQGASSEDAIADMKRIFQLVATLVILVGSGFGHLYLTGIARMAGNYFPVSSVGGGGFLGVWNWFWSISLLVVTWKPNVLLRILPNPINERLRNLIWGSKI